MSSHYDSRFDGDEDEPDYDDGDERGEDAWGCAFGERCCMPGMHTVSECHTAEMYEAYAAEAFEGV